ncbi:unnamed protein product [Caretta caretta]
MAASLALCAALEFLRVMSQLCTLTSFPACYRVPLSPGKISPFSFGNPAIEVGRERARKRHWRKVHSGHRFQVVLHNQEV